MRIVALAVDYDGTIAHHGTVSPETHAALQAVRTSGRRLLLVSGRQLEDLRQIGVDLSLFDAVVAENGGLIFDPATNSTRTLGEAPPPDFIEDLRCRRVPFSVGHVIVATEEPHERDVLAAIRERGIEWEVIFNKGAVMALPSGVNKASGLREALAAFGISAHNTAGIGDAENDHNFLRICEVAVAVGNALPAIKQRADIVLRRRNGRGVSQFIQNYLLSDLDTATHVFTKYTVELGRARNGEPVRARVHGTVPLILGASATGKSTLMGAFVERLIDQGYQVCIIDPEGDHTALDPLIVVGSQAAPPSLGEIKSALERAGAGIVINLVALRQPELVRLAPDLLSTIFGIRASLGRPHWLFIDEAHHLMPNDDPVSADVVPADCDGLCLITLRADLLAHKLLQRVTQLYVTGEDAGLQISRFAEALGRAQALPTRDSLLGLLEGEALAVRVEESRLSPAQRFRVAERRTEHLRHVRKYAEGALPPDRSFYFRGPANRLNLRAYNVSMFIEMARGVDLETWRYHLDRGDVAQWFRTFVKDPELTGEIEDLARRSGDQDPDKVRQEILDLIESRYTVAA